MKSSQAIAFLFIGVIISGMLFGFVGYMSGWFKTSTGGLSIADLQSSCLAQGGSFDTNTRICSKYIDSGQPSGDCAGGVQVTVSGGGKDPIAGTADALNGELFLSDNTLITGETSLPSAVTSISTSFPVKSSGYAMIGNDNGQSSTDRGTEYYYYKKPFSTACAPKSLGLVDIYTEGTPSYTCYDDGTQESTCNITIGTAVVDTTKIKITVSANTYLGMPNAGDNMPISYPLGVCFNVTTLSDWDKIYPSPYASGYSNAEYGVSNGKFSAPKFLQGFNILGDCYVLDTKALRDPAGEGLGRYTEFYVIFDPSSTGTVTIADTTFMHLLDLCWSRNDLLQWRLGFGDNSDQGTSYDCGMASSGNELTIYHA